MAVAVGGGGELATDESRRGLEVFHSRAFRGGSGRARRYTGGMELVLWLVILGIAGVGLVTGTIATIAMTKAPWSDK